LPVKRFGNETFVYRHGIDKLKTLNTLTNTKAILDIGAFVGDSALIFAEEFPQNPIFCFEPNPTNFSNALTTFKLNNLDTDRIKLYNIAIGAHSGHGKMLDASAASYLAFQEDEINENADIEVTTVDNFTISNGLDVGLIKIDVEGGEQDVLEGAIQVLKTQKPILLVSIYHHYEQFVGIKPWIENLNLGYKFDFFWGVSGKINEEIMLLCEVR
jgi:FkbM family methyltransferase